MRILWSSNAAWACTGYGVQAKHLLPRLKDLGHEIAQFAWYGLQGAIIETDAFRIYPGFLDPWGFDITEGHIKHWGANLVIDLRDIWVCGSQYADSIRAAGAKWACWFPVDHDPIPPLVLERAKQADYPINYSRFGTRTAKEAGLECPYIPLGVSDQYLNSQISKEEARENLGFPQDAFICSMVAANKSNPPRKAFPENFRAFKRFLDEVCPEAFLYLHTAEMNAGGIDIPALLTHIGIPRDRVRFCDQYLQACGQLGEDYLAAVYRASDVLLAAARAEGFGIPIVDAQAAGCAVITTNFTSMPELTWFGYSTEPATTSWTPMNSWIADPSVPEIYDALVDLYEMKTARPNSWALKSDLAREWSKAFSWDRLVADYWKPTLEKIEVEL